MTTQKKHAVIKILCITADEFVSTPTHIDGLACEVSTLHLDTAHSLTSQLLQARPRLSSYDYIMTFNFWSTELVANVVAQGRVPLHAPLLVYGCIASSDECDMAWGHHAIRGVRRLDTDVYPLLSRLRTLHPSARNLLIPYDRSLLTQIPELVPSCLTHTFMIAAQHYGFEVGYIGLTRDAAHQRWRMHHGPSPQSVHPPEYLWPVDPERLTVVLGMPNTGVERYLSNLETFCVDPFRTLYLHPGCAQDHGAAWGFVAPRDSMVENMVELIKRHHAGETLKKIKNITLPAVKLPDTARNCVFGTEE